MTKTITPRHKILAFYGVPITSSPAASVNYLRMTKFTQFSHNKNPQEYNRQYTDEPFQRTDVVSYAPQFDYAFDRHSGDNVLKDIMDITNKELVGDDAVRSIVVVDTETGEAIQRDYAVIPGTEGDNINIYTYSGSMKCRGEKVLGTATSTDGWQTVTFTPETED